MKEKAKAYYESNRISFAKLSSISAEVIGKPVTIDQLKKWSQEDGGWRKAVISDKDKLQKIREWLFDKMEDDLEGLSATDLTRLADTYLKLTKEVVPDIEGIDSQPTSGKIVDIAEKIRNELGRQKD